MFYWCIFFPVVHHYVKTRFISNIPRVICYVNGPQDASPDAGTSHVYTFQPASIHPPPQLENKPNHCSRLIKFSESPQSALQHPVWYVHNFTFLPLLSLNYMTSALALPVLSLQKGVVESSKVVERNESKKLMHITCTGRHILKDLLGLCVFFGWTFWIKQNTYIPSYVYRGKIAIKTQFKFVLPRVYSPYFHSASPIPIIPFIIHNKVIIMFIIAVHTHNPSHKSFSGAFEAYF